ncbi:ATP-binding cassette subfamily B protein [Pseudonocardia hierapolitana]|uniref:ATP-binding cassette subfamily B protein n=1 Tax=Pseudonocardia hierapolitana TaxID=1128676 RepID=A0A561T2A8_9PSEU|nr:ABC transporter ATP-binding protein [Pseudonocardia hierapolitana]TWF81242.1 ATP-binding cassette subfamily B protein [Pseudonocardia hierapolitana]
MTGEQLSTWRVARRLAAYRPGTFLLSLAFFVAASSSMLLVGWLLQQIFDAMSGDRPAGIGVHGVIAVLAAVELVRIAAHWGGVVRIFYLEQLRGLLRLNMLRAQMASGGAEACSLPASSGEAVSRFRDDVDDFLGFLDIALFVAGELVFAAGAITVMLTIDPLMTVSVVLPLATVVISTRMASRKIRKRRAAYRRATAEATGLLGAMFGAVLTVKTAHAGGGIVDRLAEYDERRRRAGLRDQLGTQMIDTFSRVTVSLSTGLVLLLAIPASGSGDFTVGDLALFASYVGTLVAMPRYAGRLLAGHRQAGVAVERMAALLPGASPERLVTHRPLFDEDLPHGTPARAAGVLRRLDVRDLTAVHPGSGHGVRHVELTSVRGSFVVITGPAGAGKTTLLRALLGLMPIQGGEVLWNGEPVEDRSGFFVPPRCAYVPQVPRLFSESLQDNLLLGSDDTAGVTAALRTAVFDADVAAMPEGLATAVGTRGVRLSGGQIQRAALARALVRRPDLLVLDDVSSALDVHTERQLWDRLLARRDRTLIVVSNRPATISRADQVIRLEGGRESPSPEQSTDLRARDAAA